MRNFQIFHNQLKELSWMEFAFLLRKTMFFNEPILIYNKAVAQAETQPREAADGIVIEKGSPGDLERVRQILKPLPWEFQCHIFDGVKDFFVARDADGVQHISWIYFCNHRNRFLSLGEREAEIKFCLTLPAFRGRGIYPQVLLSIQDYLRSIGMERIFMCVHRDNNPSIRGIEKAGFIRVGEIRLRKFFGIQVSPRYDTNRRTQ